MLFDGRNKSASLIEDANLFNMKNKSMHLLLYDEENHQTVKFENKRNEVQKEKSPRTNANMSPEFLTNFLETQD